MYLSKFQLFNYKSFLDSGLLDFTPVINSSLAKVNQQYQIHLRTLREGEAPISAFICGSKSKISIFARVLILFLGRILLGNQLFT